MPARARTALIALFIALGLVVPPAGAAGLAELSISATVDGVAGPITALPGTTATVEFAVTNSGSERLYSLYLWFDGVGLVDCLARDLEPGATTVCATLITVEEGPSLLEATATAWPADGDGASAAVVVEVEGVADAGDPPAPAPAPQGPLSMDVFVEGDPASRGAIAEVVAGTEVPVTFELTNSAALTLYSVYLTFDPVGRVACPERHLRPLSTMVCEATVVAPEGRADFAAVVKAWPDGGEVTDEVTVSIDGIPAVDDGLVNLALGRPTAHASSPQWSIGTDAGLAVDGDRAGDLADGSVAITYRVSEAWWEVDLGAVRTIDHVVLWNRTDCCSERLRQFHVFVSDVAFEARDIKGTTSQDGVLDVYVSDEAGKKMEIPIGRTGRFVRVQLDYLDAVLALAEVEVMGPADAPAPAVPAPAPSVALEVRADDAVTASPGPTLTPGDPVTFTYLVTNTWNGDLWSPYVWHESVGGADCPRGRIAPGETVVCSRASVVLAGAHADLVTVQAWPSDDGEASASVTAHVVGGNATAGPALDLEVLANGSDADLAPGVSVAAGADVTYRYQIENTGTETLWALTLWHDGIGEVSTCPQDGLAPGDAVDCELVAPAEIGEHAADVTAWAWDAAGGRASDADPVVTTAPLVAAVAGITLEARVNGDDADSSPGPMIGVGERVEFTFDVTNSGSTTLYGVWVSAPGVDGITCPERRLEPGASTTCSASALAEPGPNATIARSVAYDAGDNEVTGTDRIAWYVPESNGAAVRLEFLVDGLNGETPWGPRLREGDVATFTYLVANVGGVELTGIEVSDDDHGAVPCPTDRMAPGSTVICSLEEVMTLRRMETWATVTASGGGEAVTDRERLYYHVKPFGREDDLVLEVTINGIDADTPPGPVLEAGTRATIRYVVTNNAYQATMYSAQVIDPRVPASQMICQGGPTLGHYLSMVCEATITVTAGSWSNLVTAVAWSTNGSRLDASDRIHYTGVT